MAFIEAMESFPKWLKLILCIPAFALSWCAYRIVKAIKIKTNGHINSKQIAIAAFMILLCEFSWIFDLVSIAVKNKPFLGE